MTAQTETDGHFFHLAKGLSTLPDLRGHVQVPRLNLVSLASAGNLWLQVCVSLEQGNIGRKVKRTAVAVGSTNNVDNDPRNRLAKFLSFKANRYRLFVLSYPNPFKMQSSQARHLRGLTEQGCLS